MAAAVDFRSHTVSGALSSLCIDTPEFSTPLLPAQRQASDFCNTCTRKMSKAHIEFTATLLGKLRKPFKMAVPIPQTLVFGFQQCEAFAQNVNLLLVLLALVLLLGSVPLLSNPILSCRLARSQAGVTCAADCFSDTSKSFFPCNLQYSQNDDICVVLRTDNVSKWTHDGSTLPALWSGAAMLQHAWHADAVSSD